MIIFTSRDYNHSHASATNGTDQLAQFRGNLVWMNPKPAIEFHLFLPKSAVVLEEESRVFIRLEKTWIALHLINARSRGLNAELTTQVCGPTKEGEVARFPEDCVWTFAGEPAGPAGFALEIGEPETHGDFQKFREAAKEKSRLEQPSPNEVHLTAANGERVGIRLAEQGRPIVFREGAKHDWRSHWDLWKSDGPKPIRLGWMEGELQVHAGGRSYYGKFSKGGYEFRNK